MKLVKTVATSKDYRDFVLEQLNPMEGIACRAMMGEYLLYCHGVLFGGLYDNELLVKKTEGNRQYHMEEQIPYDGAKPMYRVEDVESPELLADIIRDTCETLSREQKKR